MRIAVVVFAALTTLGLVAFGLVVAQKASDSVPLTTAVAGVSSPQNTGSPNNDKAPLDLGEAVKAAVLFYIDRRCAEQHDCNGVGFSSPGADAICCL